MAGTLGSGDSGSEPAAQPESVQAGDSERCDPSHPRTGDRVGHGYHTLTLHPAPPHAIPINHNSPPVPPYIYIIHLYLQSLLFEDVLN